MKLEKTIPPIFNSIVISLGITENKYIIQKNINSLDKAIMKFQLHLSTLIVKSNINTRHSFPSRVLKLMMLIKKYVP